MRKFHFKLQKLLELKEYREREWEIKLGEITSRMEEIRQKIDACRSQRQKGFSLRAEAGSDLSQCAAAENYIRRMEQLDSSYSRDLQELTAERESIQAGYLEASRERKVFDKLREKRQLEFYKEQKKADIALLDELNSGAAARNIEFAADASGNAAGRFR